MKRHKMTLYDTEFSKKILRRLKMICFTGKFLLKLGDNRRLCLPSSFRNELFKASGFEDKDKEIMMTLGIDSYISVRVREDFENMISKMYEEGKSWMRDQKDQIQAIAARSQNFVISKVGRLVIPEDFANHAGLGEEALVIGSGGHFEIWEPELGKKKLEESLRIQKEIGLA